LCASFNRFGNRAPDGCFGRPNALIDPGLLVFHRREAKIWGVELGRLLDG
jgi:hypothetical protein